MIELHNLTKTYLMGDLTLDVLKGISFTVQPITEEEITVVREAYVKYRVCASTLRRIIDRDYGLRINHNRIHRILIGLGFSKVVLEI